MSYPQHPFVEGKQVAPKDTPYQDIKENCMALFRTMGHVPITRNSRPPGYLIVKCKQEEHGCGAACGVSCNQRDAWYTTFWRGGPCVAGTSAKPVKGLAAATATAPAAAARCHTSIHHLISIHHTPPHAMPTATFHSNPFEQLPQQRPLQQLPHPLQNAVSALKKEGSCGAFFGTYIVKFVLTTRSNARLQAKGVPSSLETGARYAARVVHMIILRLHL